MPSVESRRLKDGTTRYFVRVRDPRPGPTYGKHSSRTFATEPEAQRFCRDVDDRGAGWALDELDRAEDEAHEITLDEWADQHFAALTEPNEATVDRYRSIYAHTWSPRLGHLRLSAITRTDVAAALKAVDGKDKTIQNKWAVLTHMLKMAATDGLIPKSPTVGVKLGRRSDHEDTEHRYLTHEEFWRVLEATPPYWRPLVLFLGGTGARWGEAVALQVGDVDLDKATVRITKAAKRKKGAPGGVEIGPTKTRKSRRTVTLPDELVEALRPLCEGRPKSALLFTAPRGGPVKHKTFYYDVWMLKALGVRTTKTDRGRKPPERRTLEDPQPRIHDLRHSHVAWLIAAGAALPIIQARLGHEKITTTIDTYGHLLPDLQRAAADAANVVLRRPGDGPRELG